MEFDSLWKDFLEETLPLIQRVESDLLALERLFSQKEEEEANAEQLILRVLGDLHTIKGNCGMMGLSALSSLVHEMEDVARMLQEDPRGDRIEELLRALDRLREGVSQAGEAGGAPPAPVTPSGAGSPPPAPSSSSEEAKGTDAASSRGGMIRVDFHKLDDLLDSVGELIIQHTSLLDALSSLRRAPSTEAWERVENQAERLGKIVGEIQEGITKARMLPIGSVFARFARTVRDLARKEGKKIRFETRGGDVEVDKSILDALAEPLVHLVRNAVGHGIEEPALRRAAKKPEEGLILLSAQPASGVVLVSLADDGGGIDRERLLAGAKRLNIPTEGLSQEELQQLIFLPGFSTASRLSSLSGRGVGLDVVKRTIETLGGRIEVTSVPGKGTRFLLSIPLSLSLIRALLVEVGGEVYAIPLSHVIESFRLSGATLLEVGGGKVVRWRGLVLPILDLVKHFRVPGEHPKESPFCVVVRDGTRVRGLAVSALLGQQEIVAKSLKDTLGTLPGISGATLLGDGRVVPIVDVFSLASRPEERL